MWIELCFRFGKLNLVTCPRRQVEKYGLVSFSVQQCVDLIPVTTLHAIPRMRGGCEMRDADSKATCSTRISIKRGVSRNSRGVMEGTVSLALGW